MKASGAKLRRYHSTIASRNRIQNYSLNWVLVFLLPLAGAFYSTASASDTPVLQPSATTAKAISPPPSPQISGDGKPAINNTVPAFFDDSSMKVEFAVRWLIGDGGPKVIEEVQEKIKAGPSDDNDRFLVRYSTITAPANAPSGATAILRERNKTNGKKF